MQQVRISDEVSNVQQHSDGRPRGVGQSRKEEEEEAYLAHLALVAREQRIAAKRIRERNGRGASAFDVAIVEEKEEKEEEEKISKEAPIAKCSKEERTEEEQNGRGGKEYDRGIKVVLQAMARKDSLVEEEEKKEISKDKGEGRKVEVERSRRSWGAPVSIQDIVRVEDAGDSVLETSAEDLGDFLFYFYILKVFIYTLIEESGEAYDDDFQSSTFSSALLEIMPKDDESKREQARDAIRRFKSRS